jgi:hypothetical protein
MIYYLRVMSTYFYPVKAYFSSMEELLNFCTYFIEKSEFISEEAKIEFEYLSDERQKEEIADMFTVVIIDKKDRPDYRKLFMIDGLSRVAKRRQDEAKDESAEACIQAEKDE